MNVWKYTQIVQKYVGCSKSIQCDFFPWKLMKHERCAVVGRWRVPSCAYMDFFPPADSVSRMQPACECVYAAHVALLFSAKMMTAPWFLGQTRKSTTHHQWSRWSGIWGCCLLSLACPARLPDRAASVSSLAALAWISQTLSTWPNHRSKWSVPNQCLFPPPPQVLGQWHEGPAWPKSALGQWARHFGLLRAYRNKRRSPLTCSHLWIGCTTPEFLWCPWHRRRKPAESSEWFPLGYPQASGKIWCNTVARVVPSFLQKITMRRTLRIHSPSHADCTRLTLSAGRKKTMYAHEGTLHLPAKAHLPCFISFCGKKSCPILFEQPM